MSPKERLPMSRRAFLKATGTLSLGFGANAVWVGVQLKKRLGNCDSQFGFLPSEETKQRHDEAIKMAEKAASADGISPKEQQVIDNLRHEIDPNNPQVKDCQERWENNQHLRFLTGVNTCAFLGSLMVFFAGLKDHQGFEKT